MRLADSLDDAAQRQIELALLEHQALFVGDGFTIRINELEPAESHAILDLLFAHVARSEFIVRWRRKDNDVAFWDNRVTRHYAVDDYRPRRRATILGDKHF